ncbi:MAG TPA: ATP-binding protein [Polyangia bacterium]|nr:ATP-binding protein [Polyangia bacterium]
MIPAVAADDLAAAYLEALRKFVADPSEENLARGYELGRRALGDGQALIDWAALHEAAQAELALGPADGERFSRAGTFFRESLAAFEMTQRGYVEANRWLERLNQQLREEVTEKQRVAARLEEANRDLESFSFSVAHDLRAPVRRIEGFADMLTDDHREGMTEEAIRAATRIKAAAQRMSELIDGLISLARTSRSELTIGTVDLAARARTIVAALRESSPERTVTVDIAEPLEAKGDARLLGAVLDNLLGNAWKFTGKQPDARIEVGVDRTRTPCVYFVRDNGSGFNPAQAHRLFGVFQRLHTEEAFPGTGIGLATVERIIRRHGGRVWAQGAVGGGATFFFTVEPEPS